MSNYYVSFSHLIRIVVNYDEEKIIMKNKNFRRKYAVSATVEFTGKNHNTIKRVFF